MAVARGPRRLGEWLWRKHQIHGPNGSGECAKDMDPMAVANAPKTSTQWLWREGQGVGEGESAKGAPAQEEQRRRLKSQPKGRPNRRGESTKDMDPMAVANAPTTSPNGCGECTKDIDPMAVARRPGRWAEWQWRKRHRYGPNDSGESVKAIGAPAQEEQRRRLKSQPKGRPNRRGESTKDMDPMAVAKAPKRLAVAKAPKEHQLKKSKEED
eukprot:CAMPEP_0201654108 /NCGR_PEP_ID=MMETSP0493-20130528/45329_1 /ASSEMBLY_ACC=CAM_ASM_000838 /TAXON_ID=420259 /ORGANISM="Thalassiosira gravida, Strain GMp14c1" /LENGTH=211 /DNA_ID=CAMNT_0048130657 /DNA_START=577 /DNA_END=1213 /DNA_ORIENTATION=-